MLFSFRIISDSVRHLSRDTINHMTVKQNIFDFHVISVKLRISRNSFEKGHDQN